MKDGTYWIIYNGVMVVGEIMEGGLFLVGDETEHSPADAEIICAIEQPEQA